MRIRVGIMEKNITALLLPSLSQYVPLCGVLHWCGTQSVKQSNSRFLDSVAKVALLLVCEGNDSAVTYYAFGQKRCLSAGLLRRVTERHSLMKGGYQPCNCWCNRAFSAWTRVLSQCRTDAMIVATSSATSSV